ncbi:protein related to RNA helicase [Ophiocordyceps sinensis CO18]|uniref:Protein related to RNA helicase n=1 Tax=Ophiocordyceps sinensis (strain Co18 / CGMCC 3.14243) TaxID=911162 RepID=T5A517_OPHSC|nr:protein related to RNA helicase [Ophiocordyceps sinensis CO18]
MPGSPTRPGRGLLRHDRDTSRRRAVSRRGNRYDDQHPRQTSPSPERKRRRSTQEERRSASPAVDTREPRRRRHASHHHRDKAKAPVVDDAAEKPLSYSARPLVKAHLQTLEPLFVHYLNLQKCKDARVMDDREFRGRWKSFVGKWNRNELAEGWYDPEMLARISTWEVEEKDDQEGREAPRQSSSGRLDDDYERGGSATGDDDDENYGPTLPRSKPRRRMGADVPTLQDLDLRDELIKESRGAEREALRDARKADRAQQKERLEELAPRAEPGTRERKLEKRREANDAMRQLRDKSPGLEAGNDKELMGGGDLVDEYRQMKATARRRKSERQIQKEELERANKEMMEAKRKAWQQREEGTVSMLRELAKRRFG